MVEFLLMSLWWLGASGLVAYVAARRGRTAQAWFFAALLLSPPMAALALLGLQPRP